MKLQFFIFTLFFFVWPRFTVVSLSTITPRRTFLSQSIAVPALIAQKTVADEGNLNSFRYNDEWTGTSLPLLGLDTASKKTSWDMGRWPDPILRRPASPVDSKWLGTPALKYTCDLLEKTARENEAVGLAAQQCGIDARIVYIETPRRISMVNPKIVGRSDEDAMRVWTEFCLVLPTTFAATVLRDAWVEIDYQDWQGARKSIKLFGESARCAQHELDHDRGILTLDHIGLEEMENDVMRGIEKEGHDQRQLSAYSRSVEGRS